MCICVCVIGWLWLPEANGVRWRAEHPSHGRGQLEVLVHFLVFYVLLSSRSHVEIEIFLF